MPPGRVARVVLPGRPDTSPARLPIGTDAGLLPGASPPETYPAAGQCLSSRTEWPYMRASSAQMRPAASVTKAAMPVSVTTARWPGSGPAVSHTQAVTPCPAPG